MAEANRRVTDLSYGHFDLYVEQIESFEECSPPCIENLSVGNENPSVLVRNQMKTLLQAHPDMYHSRRLISTLLAAQIYEEPFNKTGDIFAIGHALDFKRISGSRRPLILASPCGEDGHILQLLRLRHETRMWGKGSSAKLSVLSNPHSGKGYWSNTGGKIRQIVFSCNENEAGTWLAVRQDSTTTIFRPCYGQLSRQPWNPDASRKFSTSSRLNANPVATLPSSEGSIPGYSDLSFNPWYSRQIAVVNSLGIWKIFEFEKSHQRNSAEKVIRNKSGSINNDSCDENSSQSQEAGLGDGWHRILWVCDIHTIVVCNRSHLAIFDVSAEPQRLNPPILLCKDSPDLILDVKRSSSDKAQFFVLTTTRVFWIQVFPRKEESSEKNLAGGRILLSQRHFRSPTDLSLKLIPVRSQTISILLASSIHPLVNVFWFGRNSGITDSLSSRRGSLSLLNASKYRILIQSGQLIPCDIRSKPRSHILRPEEEYSELGFEFFQLYALTPNIQIVSTLIAAKLFTAVDACNLKFHAGFHAKAPKKIERKSRRHHDPWIRKDPFIVPDIINKEQSQVICSHQKRSYEAVYDPKISKEDDLRFRLNWRKVFQRAFKDEDAKQQNVGSNFSPKAYSINEVLSIISSRIQTGSEHQCLFTILIYEIINNNTISEDLGHISVSVAKFIENLKKNFDNSTSMIMTKSALISCPALNFSSEFGENFDLMNIFDRLLELWMSTKPPEFPNRSRGATYKIIRDLAIDIYFSSFTISFQKKNIVAGTVTINSLIHEARASNFSTLIDLNGHETSSTPIYLETARTQHTDKPNSQYSSQPKSPSEYSHATSSFDPEEDSAISRLRQYAISIKSKSVPLGNAPFLKAWPNTPGSDPSLYRYEAEVEVGSDEDRLSNHRVEARRRRRTEKFLRQLSSVENEEVPPYNSFNQQSASQQETFNLSFPSQVDDISMTQPDRGVYGSRSLQKRKNKKQRTAGF